MAREVVETFVDDLDGSDKEVGTVRFALDGTAYEIDLSADNADEFRGLFAPYISAGRKERASLAAHRGTVRVPRTGARTDPAQTARIREWAQEHGYQVSGRGRISREILDAYNASS